MRGASLGRGGREGDTRWGARRGGRESPRAKGARGTKGGPRGGALRRHGHPGGAHGTDLPLAYAAFTGERILTLPTGEQHVFGGSAIEARVYHRHAHAGVGIAQTRGLTPDLEEGDEITSLQVITDASNFRNLTSGGANVGTWMEIRASADGGETWRRVPRIGHDEDHHGKPGYLPVAFAAQERGNDLRLRVTLGTMPGAQMMTPHLREATLIVTYTDEEGDAEEETYTLRFNEPDDLDAGASGGVVIADGELRLATGPRLLVADVNGRVNDLIVHPDANGDGEDDIAVATGGVLAGNDPGNLEIIADADAVINEDYSLYFLHGKTGMEIQPKWRDIDPKLEPEHLGYGDVHPRDAPDGVPEVLATLWKTAGELSRVVGIDANGVRRLKYEPDADKDKLMNRGVGVVSLQRSATEVLAVVGTRGEVPTEWGDTPTGYVFALKAPEEEHKPAELVFRASPDDKGYYRVRVPVSKKWLYGAYVLEVSVDWKAKVEGVSEVAQAAHFYDHFVVKPEFVTGDPFPFYRVHLVVWQREWDWPPKNPEGECTLNCKRDKGIPITHEETQRKRD